MKKTVSMLLALLVCLPAALAEAPETQQKTETEAVQQETAEAPETKAAETEDVETEAPKEETPAPETPAQETPVPEATEPQETPVPEATESQTTPVPEATETADPQTTPEIPEETPAADEIEGWTLDAESGAHIASGKLAELLQGEDALRIGITTVKQIMLEDFPLARLKNVTLEPDAERFPGENFRIVISGSERLADELSPETIESADEESVQTIYVWVLEELPAPTEEPVEPGELRLKVTEQDVKPGEWSSAQPVFTLEGIGANPGHYSYAAIILDERIMMLSTDIYMPEEEGIYTLRFAILDDMDDLQDKSEKYTLWLDYTAPLLDVQASMDKSYTMTLGFSDALSGVDAYSLDAGETWTPLAEDETATSYTAKKKTTFAAGSIQLRDRAGNISVNEADIVLDKVSSGGGGGGSGSGDDKPAKTHASGDGDSALYNAYQLELPTEQMHALKIGGEYVALTLALESEGLANGDAARFTAELAEWKKKAAPVPAATANAGNAPDTLVLHAVLDGIGADAPYTCEWSVNGSVLRKLYNSGISYLVLEAGQHVMTLPTQGFTSGTVYADLKMQGVSTSEFEYLARMEIDPAAASAEFVPAAGSHNFLADCKPGLNVTVQGTSYEIFDDGAPEMYASDVYCGGTELMNYPYGEYPATADAQETEG